MSRHITIDELEKKEFSGEIVDNCFFVDDILNPTYAVSVSQIYKWIKEQANRDGLLVRLRGESLIFIKGDGE